LDGIDLKGVSEPERHLFDEILRPTLADSALGHVLPQHEVIDTEGRRRRLDFAIVTPITRLAIELDGYRYHAEGVISREHFDDQLARQNELVIEGWRVLRFSWDQVTRDPEKCRDALRRALVSDPILHPSYSNQVLSPHLVQQEALERLQKARESGNRRGLVVLATGLGKTLLAAFDAKRCGGRILFIVHNNGILAQAQAAFRRVMPDARTGLFNGFERAPDADVLFANIASLRSGDGYRSFSVDAFDYIVVDEFHHAAARSYEKVLAHFKPKFLLGLTATPDRTDRKAILHLVDDNLIFEMGQAEAIQRGFLVPFEYHALKDDIDYTNIRHDGFRYDLADLNKALIIEKRDSAILEQVRRLAGSEKAVGFCVSIEHADRAAEHFVEKGIKATAIHSRLTKDEREKRIEGFRAGTYQMAFVRDLFNEGIDVPDLGAVIFMRPTESKVIFIQQLGRGLRLCSGKRAVKVLDFIGNYVNAERVTDYLAEMGAEVSLERLKKKPILHFDNGCSVSFQAEVIDTILHLDQSAVRGDALVKEYFELQRRLGRVPTALELGSMGRYRLRQYIATFGTWRTFLDRLRRIDPEVNLEAMEWPGDLGDASADRVAALCDSESVDFKDELVECSRRLQELFKRVEAIEARPGKGVNRIAARRRVLDAVHEAIRDASASAREVGLVLDLTSPEAVRLSRPDAGAQVPLAGLIEKFSDEMELLSTSRDVRGLGRSLLTLWTLANGYQRYVAWLGSRSPDRRRLRELTLALAREMEVALSCCDSVLRGAE
jgi:superfamily II DNA or RNA helicase